MIEFVNNNALFLIIFIIFFFINKSFHSRISFNFNIIKYKSIRERLITARIKNIFNYMNKTLIFAREALIKLRKLLNCLMKPVNGLFKSCIKETMQQSFLRRTLLAYTLDLIEFLSHCS